MDHPQAIESIVKTSEQLEEAREKLQRWDLPPLRSSFDWFGFASALVRAEDRLRKTDKELNRV